MLSRGRARRTSPRPGRHLGYQRDDCEVDVVVVGLRNRTSRITSNSRSREEFAVAWVLSKRVLVL